ncbi:hypothetical protein FJD34_02910 [Pseudomonas brenneri]|uniref:Uncharacterized protein n=1 Tax=Pseudomonas brenneri TaxID=129817 RepID=A0A5B2ULK2_9PSED|nr:hypothetical protein F1720_23715 [Pseudomonas brenneri]TWR82357.1 hypothetical protein FJD34_02910 [Pseudomonas brenneri]
MLAKGVNDNACMQGKRGALKFFASKLAPTVVQETSPAPPLPVQANTATALICAHSTWPGCTCNWSRE